MIGGKCVGMSHSDIRTAIICKNLSKFNDVCEYLRYNSDNYLESSIRKTKAIEEIHNTYLYPKDKKVRIPAMNILLIIAFICFISPFAYTYFFEGEIFWPTLGLGAGLCLVPLFICLSFANPDKYAYFHLDENTEVFIRGNILIKLSPNDLTRTDFTINVKYIDLKSITKIKYNTFSKLYSITGINYCCDLSPNSANEIIDTINPNYFQRYYKEFHIYDTFYNGDFINEITEKFSLPDIEEYCEFPDKEKESPEDFSYLSIGFWGCIGLSIILFFELYSSVGLILKTHYYFNDLILNILFILVIIGLLTSLKALIIRFKKCKLEICCFSSELQYLIGLTISSLILFIITKIFSSSYIEKFSYVSCIIVIVFGLICFSYYYFGIGHKLSHYRFLSSNLALYLIVLCLILGVIKANIEFGFIPGLSIINLLAFFYSCSRLGNIIRKYLNRDKVVIPPYKNSTNKTRGFLE